MNTHTVRVVRPEIGYALQIRRGVMVAQALCPLPSLVDGTAAWTPGPYVEPPKALKYEYMSLPAGSVEA